jgi:SpoIID/LytB domain protein
MKKLTFLAILFSLILPMNAFAASIPDSFTLKGSGYGHGVGLSQIGAKGQALEGKSSTEIINYYFPNAQVAPVEDTQTIRVNTGHQISAVSFSITSEGQFNLSSETNTSVSFETSTILSFTISGKEIVANSRINKSPVVSQGISKLWTVGWIGESATVTQKIGAATFKMKYGFIQLRAVPITGIGYRIEVTENLRLHDQYLYGISEVPSSWPMAAMASQVIASRTYAISRMSKIRKDCDCHVYNTKYDQNFSGATKEAEVKYGLLWKAAVDSTLSDASHGYAITYSGIPINVYFFSSSGGATQKAIDVWGIEIPYLVSVADPWSLDPLLNPKYANWERTISQSDMAKAFGLPDVVKYVVKGRTLTGSVLNVIAYSSSGAKKTLPVGTFKTTLKIPSSWFDLPVAITLPDTSTVVGTTAAN